MRVIDRKSAILGVCIILFALVMAGIHLLAKGVSQDFGIGFATGGLVFGVLISIAVGWRRGELD